MSLPEDLNMDALPVQPYSSPRLLKWFYCTHRVSSTLCLLPYWALKYAFSTRPRQSWSLAETLLVDFTRRVSAITDMAGVQHATRDPTTEPDPSSLKETRFEWVPGIAGDLVRGVVDDEQVRPLKRVGTFIWERADDVREDYANGNWKDSEVYRKDEDSDDESTVGDSLVGSGDLVGLYFHGGGYTHFSAHENAQTSAIPRRLMLYNYFASIHAVEYRLLPAYSFPAALQDALSAYAHLIRSGVPAHKIVLIGDSAGGNIILALARWLRDEKKLPQAGGMLLLSPWCDPSHSFPHSTTSYVPRPNPEDYLADEPTARRLLVTSLLGSKPHSYLTSPYISPASQLGPHGCFNAFPPSFIHYGDAERLEEEIESLVRGMKRDGVPLLDVEKTPDAVHDVLMVRFWNEDVRRRIYDRIADWCDRLVKFHAEKDRELGIPVASRSRAGSRASLGKPPSYLSVTPLASGSGSSPSSSSSPGSRSRAASGGADLIRMNSSYESSSSSSIFKPSSSSHLAAAEGATQLPNGNLKVGKGHTPPRVPSPGQQGSPRVGLAPPLKEETVHEVKEEEEDEIQELK
ncbi:hypothetical protein JCM11251_001565 [Rhodosporidiobolus azoricus]